MYVGRMRYLILIAACLFAGVSAADEVTLPYRGLILNARLEMAKGKTLADGVILITHGSLAHNDMELYRTLQELLKEKGRNSLAINLSLGLDNRHGMYECATTHRHRHTDALDEIGAWLEWLKGKGVKKVVLLGHSLAGNQTARYAAERDSTLIRGIVLVAPGMWDDAVFATYERRYKQPLKPVLERAESLVKAGKGDSLLERTDFLTCAKTTVRAASFVSYYLPSQRPSTPALLPKVGKPVIVFIGTQDDIHPDVIEKVKPLADGKRVQLKIIEGADAFFRDLYAEDVVDTIEAFLAST
jgi:pimeloyl-ACP methyl ester carboxylesterase